MSWDAATKAVLVTALDIARAAPEDIATAKTLIPANLIRQLRMDLKACGVDWQAGA